MKISTGHFLARQKKTVPSWFNPVMQPVEYITHPAFAMVSLHCSSNASSSHHAKTAVRLLVLEGDQHNKRVGK
ncbi:MAG TPA: hypothetical protein PKW33_03480 [Anaerolineaceae bacterium]|nr:hypothetical protein [Anaerolineaceae bacterium]HPN50623.1 hypothetical protein [Anaerolineaceae bacterium]